MPKPCGITSRHQGLFFNGINHPQRIGSGSHRKDPGPAHEPFRQCGQNGGRAPGARHRNEFGAHARKKARCGWREPLDHGQEQGVFHNHRMLEQACCALALPEGEGSLGYRGIQIPEGAPPVQKPKPPLPEKEGGGGGQVIGGASHPPGQQVRRLVQVQDPEIPGRALEEEEGVVSGAGPGKVQRLLPQGRNPELDPGGEGGHEGVPGPCVTLGPLPVLATYQ